MIGADDRIALPHGVEVRDAALHDVLRAEPVAVNETGLATLAAATPAAAAAELERRHGAGVGSLDDAIGFCADLNDRLLLNVVAKGGVVTLALRWLRCLPLLLPLGVLPRAPVARRHVDTSGLLPLARSSAAALGPHAALLCVVSAGAVALIVTALGAPAWPLAPALGLTIAATVTVHELAHLAALLGVPACVVTRGLRVAVVHRGVSSRRVRLVAASGPVAGLAFAALLLAALSLAPSAELGAMAAVGLVNAVGLTVASRDGRALCGCS